MIEVRELQKSFGATLAVRRRVVRRARWRDVRTAGAERRGEVDDDWHAHGGDSSGRRFDSHQWHGQSPTEASTRKAIGFAPQNLSLYEELSAVENLIFFGRLYQLVGKELHERVGWALDFAGLSDRQKDRVKTFSGGMKRRLNLAVALVHDPHVIFLDEPTAGVDPQSRNHIFERIEELRSQGRTVIYTTHYMEEAQRLCDRVAIMDGGKVLDLDTVPALIERYGGRSVVKAEFARPPADSVALPAPLDGLSLEIRIGSAAGGSWPVVVGGCPVSIARGYAARSGDGVSDAYGQEFARLMRIVLTMAMKDLRLMSRDWLGMFFIIGFPIVMGLFFGQVMGPFDTKRASLNIAVVDEDNTPMSAQFVESLRGTGNIEIEKARSRAGDGSRTPRPAGRNDRDTKGLWRVGRHAVAKRAGD